MAHAFNAATALALRAASAILESETVISASMIVLRRIVSRDCVVFVARAGGGFVVEARMYTGQAAKRASLLPSRFAVSPTLSSASATDSCSSADVLHALDSTRLSFKPDLLVCLCVEDDALALVSFVCCRLLSSSAENTLEPELLRRLSVAANSSAPVASQQSSPESVASSGGASEASRRVLCV